MSLTQATPVAAPVKADQFIFALV